MTHLVSPCTLTSWGTSKRLVGFARIRLGRKSSYGVYTLGFFCEEAELNIELDGSQHGFPDQRRHDQEREKSLQSRGIKTLRFWNSHLRQNAQKKQSAQDTVV